MGRSNDELLEILTELVNRMADCEDTAARDAFDAECRSSITKDEIQRLTKEEPERMREILSVMMAWTVQWEHPELASLRELPPEYLKIKKR